MCVYVRASHCHIEITRIFEADRRRVRISTSLSLFSRHSFSLYLCGCTYTKLPSDSDRWNATAGNRLTWTDRSDANDTHWECANVSYRMAMCNLHNSTWKYFLYLAPMTDVVQTDTERLRCLHLIIFYSRILRSIWDHFFLTRISNGWLFKLQIENKRFDKYLH